MAILCINYTVYNISPPSSHVFVCVRNMPQKYCTKFVLRLFQLWNFRQNVFWPKSDSLKDSWKSFVLWFRGTYIIIYIFKFYLKLLCYIIYERNKTLILENFAILNILEFWKFWSLFEILVIFFFTFVRIFIKFLQKRLDVWCDFYQNLYKIFVNFSGMFPICF